MLKKRLFTPLFRILGVSPPARAASMAVILGLMGTVCPHQAQAAMVFCNKTKEPIEAAIGYRDTVDDDNHEDWFSEGWWRIEPGQCSRVYSDPLKQRFYFYYAAGLSTPTPEHRPFLWGGKYEFCTDTKAFRVQGDGNCDARGYKAKGFQQVDVGVNIRDYTLDFRDDQ
ncbi:MAG: DUF1036 domain-containing protein [Alphaproteobacteria bacterium]|nr:DUF1036 domain-containing protein [Alphaproteobacteria bacterium]MBV8549393.1 DUF1036 domain-containing protein [Alphaproteobacteria bacterium]